MTSWLVQQNWIFIFFPKIYYDILLTISISYNIRYRQEGSSNTLVGKQEHLMCLRAHRHVESCCFPHRLVLHVLVHVWPDPLNNLFKYREVWWSLSYYGDVSSGIIEIFYEILIFFNIYVKKRESNKRSLFVSMK